MLSVPKTPVRLASLLRQAGSLALLSAAAVAPGAAATHAPRETPTAGFNAAVVDLVLAGNGSSLTVPVTPTLVPYAPACQSLIDPGFSGHCVVATGPGGAVAGIVEVESGVGTTAASRGAGPQERDLVWRRQGGRWSLALRRVFQVQGDLTSEVYASARTAPGESVLVFVTPSGERGFGHELDVVGTNGRVELYRFLGQGFTVLPPQGGLVTYVPGWAEKAGPTGEYDQTFIKQLDGLWTVVSEQYVPDGAALAQHRGPLSDQAPAPKAPVT